MCIFTCNVCDVKTRLSKHGRCTSPAVYESSSERFDLHEQKQTEWKTPPYLKKPVLAKGLILATIWNDSSSF